MGEDVFFLTHPGQAKSEVEKGSLSKENHLSGATKNTSFLAPQKGSVLEGEWDHGYFRKI